MRNHTFRKILLSVVVATLCVLLAYFIVQSKQVQTGTKSAAQPAEPENATTEPDSAPPEEPKQPNADEETPKTEPGPQHRLPESPESTTQRVEARAHTPAEVEAFVDARPFALERVDKYLTQKDVPVLVDMLGDPQFRKDWGVLSKVLARLDKGTNAQHAIIHMIRRGDIWPGNDRDLRRFVWTKINAVATLGHTNGDVARATVRDALTEDGAAKLAEEWLGRDLPAQFRSNPGRAVGAVRGRAAMGLVYSVDEDNARLVEKLYESVAPVVVKQRARQRESSLGFYDLTLEEQNLDVLYGALVSALATRDLIRKVGYDQFLQIAKDNDALYRALGGYLSKYSEGY